MKSVLVDFYNLSLKNAELKSPNENERKEIIEFFKTHAPQVIEKLTDQRKQQIRDFESRFESIIYNPEESLQALLDNKVLYIDSRKTLDGYEARHGISWFDSRDFHGFIEGYHYIKDLIDSYIRGDWKVLKDEDIGDPYYAYHMRPYIEELIDKGYITISEWKISKVKARRVSMYTPDREMEIIIKQYRAEIDKIQELELPKELRPRGSDFRSSQIYFGELFPSIYDEAISVLEGKLPIQRCGRNNCNNIFLKSGKGSGNRKYCSECSTIKTYRKNRNEYNKEKAQKVHRTLCDLIDKWLNKLKRDSVIVTAAELEKGLKEVAKKEGIKNTPFSKRYNSVKSLGQYLRHVKKMLEDEYRIKYKIEGKGSEYTYHFKKANSSKDDANCN